MTAGPPSVLLLCFGNPGRLDDGLGIELAEFIGAAGLDGVTVQADYQLQVEDAADIAAHDTVLFVDAAVSGPEPFFLRPVVPEASLGFSSHTLTPEALMAVARDMFGARTAGYTLGIRGYDFNEFGESLSPAARQNLACAQRFLLRTLRTRNFPTDDPEEDDRAFMEYENAG